MVALAALVATVLCVAAGAEAARPACPGGVFVSHAVGGSGVPPLLVMTADGRVSAMGSCTVRTLKGNRRWPVRAKLETCDGAPRTVTLRGRWTTGCDGLALALRGKRFRRDLAATRSACGDGFVDVAGGESCEAASDCGLGRRCGDDCRCEDTDCIPGDVEERLGLNRAAADSDGDGIGDGAEDSDGDGVLNCDEIAAGTALDDPDSDDDGSTDGQERANGTDPLDPVSNVLAPGAIVTGAISYAGESDRYAFTIDVPSRQVMIRAVDLDGSALYVCVTTYDAAGGLYGAPRCGADVARVVRSYGPGTYTIVVTDDDGKDTGAYRLQYLPIEPAAATTLPVGPDAFVDADLPRGLLNLYRFTLAGPRRVAIRAAERGPVAPSVLPFEPCFVVLSQTGDSIAGTQDCNPADAARDVALVAGTYYVLVNEEIDDADGPYRLRVLPFQPETATGPQCRTLVGWGDDIDVFRITVDAVSTVDVTLTKESSEPGFNPCLQLWSSISLDAFHGAAECSGPVSVGFVLGPGTYYATVHDDFRTSPGTYCLGWQ